MKPVSVLAPSPAEAVDQRHWDRAVDAFDERLIVRPFEPGDAAAVRALFIAVNRAIAPPDHVARFERYIAGALREEIDSIVRYYGTRGGQFHVAIAAGSLVGMFGLERPDRDVAELRRMYVDTQFRGRGLGRRLLTSAEKEARNAGCTRLILSTSELQPAALALYRNAGYREVRQEVAARASNKTIGGKIRRFHFEKALDARP